MSTRHAKSRVGWAAVLAVVAACVVMPTTRSTWSAVQTVPNNVLTSRANIICNAGVPGNLPNTGLLSYWRLGESAGTAAADSGPTGTTLAYTTGVTKSVSRSAVETDASVVYQNPSQRIDSTTTPAYRFNGTSPFTASLWVYIPSAATLAASSNYSYILDAQNYAATRNGWNVLYDKPFQQIQFERWVNNVSDGIVAVKTATLTPARWHHFTFVYTGTQAHIYVDGALRSTSTATAALSSMAGFTIGGRAGYAPSWVWGFDDVAVWNRALTAFEVVQVHATKDCGYRNTVYRTAGLAAHWPLGGSTKDTVGGRDGVYTSTTTTKSVTATPGDYATRFNAGATFSVPFAADLNPGTWSMSTWVNINPAGEGSNRVLASTTNGSTGWSLRRTAANDWAVTAGNTPVVTAAGGSPGIWRHLVVVATPSTVTLYMDGARVADNTSTTITPATSEPFQLGGSTNTTTVGRIDETSIYTTALTAGQVAALYAAK